MLRLYYNNTVITTEKAALGSEIFVGSIVLKCFNLENNFQVIEANSFHWIFDQV